jgi:transcriptional regulator with XRE-family HTH domain
MDTFLTVGEAIRTLREDLGVSTGDLGRLIGVSQPTVWRWEHDRSQLRTAHLAKLVKLHESVR